MYPEILEQLDVIIYTAEGGERSYTGGQILELAKGNLHYAQSLYNRASWQGIETLIEEDLREGEVIEFNNQYLITGGDENVRVIDPETLLFQYADEHGMLSSKDDISIFNEWVEENL